jgi:hypothetical protein
MSEEAYEYDLKETTEEKRETKKREKLDPTVRAKRRKDARARRLHTRREIKNGNYDANDTK